MSPNLMYIYCLEDLKFIGLPPRYILTLFLEHQSIAYAKRLSIKYIGEYSEVSESKYRILQKFKLQIHSEQHIYLLWPQLKSWHQRCHTLFLTL